MTPELELAWAAGLFEGEGCMYINKHNNNHVNLAMSSTDLDVLQAWQRIVGAGAIYPLKWRSGVTKKQAWQWSVGARGEVLRIILLLRPYMFSRRGEKADECLTLVRVPLKQRATRVQTDNLTVKHPQG